MQVDITDDARCIDAIDALSQRARRLDVVVCAAGINTRAPFDTGDLDTAKRLFDVNVWGSVNVLRASASLLRESRHGSVVVITSTSGLLGFPNSSSYAMSKMALTGLVRCLAIEWAADGVRVNAVAPALVPTPMNADVRAQTGYLETKIARIPLGRPITTDEVADTVCFLAGTRSSGITGQVLNVDGGAAVLG